MNSYVLITLIGVLINFCSVSCSNDKGEFIQELISNEEITKKEEIINTISISPDFDWSNIPSDYSNSVWQIKDNFDLAGQTILLPDNVTLSFIGGAISNGTVKGDKTTISSDSSNQIFSAINLDGDFSSSYLKPIWFGAVMDGITDDRDAFVETLKQSNNIASKVLVEKDMFLDVEKIAEKSIFLEDNSWIEGANDAKIIINNLLSPAFYMVLTENITIKDISFLYDNSYDASYDWSLTIDNDTNQQQLENYLTKNKNIKFNHTNPVFKGPSAFHTIFSIEATESVLFENVTFKANGNTADTFMQFVFKFKEQYTENQTINDELLGTTKIPKNITFKNVTFDGTIMGIQGNVDGFKVDNLKSYRYSDLQNADGSNLGGFVGGDAHKFPPPHLLYLNTDSSINNHYPSNIELKNVIDYGEYVGTIKTRGASGYCNSLKMVDRIENVYVDNYKSYRRDGLADIGNVTNGVFKNLYSESDSSIFEEGIIFKSVRFLGDLENCTFNNVIIKDNAESANFYPFDVASGNNVEMENLHVYVKKLITEDNLCFGISGSNNIIKNTSLNIENHISTKSYGGVVHHNINAMNTCSNNDYNIIVNGWRGLEKEPIKQRTAMYFQSSANSNWNYCKIEDTSNGFITEQEGNTITDTWTRTEIADLETGNSHQLVINIPPRFMIREISVNTLETLVEGIDVSIGTDINQKNNLIEAISIEKGNVSNLVNENILHYGGRNIYLFANKDFKNRGKVEVSVVLIKTEGN